MAQGLVCDVSISGALVHTPLPVPLLAYVQVQFIVERQERRIIGAIEGQVVRRVNDGFGLEWCEFAPEAVRALATGSVKSLAESSHDSGALPRRMR